MTIALLPIPMPNTTHLQNHERTTTRLIEYPIEFAQ
jgi:hypothetical protein